MHNFYNIMYNELCFSDRENERNENNETGNNAFYLFCILICQISISQRFAIRGGGNFKEIFYPILFGR